MSEHVKHEADVHLPSSDPIAESFNEVLDDLANVSLMDGMTITATVGTVLDLLAVGIEETIEDLVKADSSETFSETFSVAQLEATFEAFKSRVQPRLDAMGCAVIQSIKREFKDLADDDALVAQLFG